MTKEQHFAQAVENAKKKYKNKEPIFGWTRNGEKMFLAIKIRERCIFSSSGTIEEIKQDFIKKFL